MAESDDPQTVPVPKWVISDTHFGHANILEYCPWRRTWAGSVADHDAAIIAAWCERVKPDDWVLHLGDFALGTKETLLAARRSVPGRILLVRGNHDRSKTAMREAGIDLVCSAVHILDGDRYWFGRHNPAAFSPREAARGVRLLHGHCHGNGLPADIHPAVRAQAVDCSLDALRSIGPVPWETVSSGSAAADGLIA